VERAAPKIRGLSASASGLGNQQQKRTARFGR
jgi:hypothetical protein